MKEHMPTIAMLVALFMLLATLVTLALHGQKPDSPILLGLVSAASGMGGAIGGFSMNSRNNHPSQIANLPNATTLNVSTTEADTK